MFTPSISMLPDCNSTSRNKALINEVLPAPVLPTTPIFSWASTRKERLSSTVGRSSRYRIVALLNSMVPCLTHLVSSSSAEGFGFLAPGDISCRLGGRER
ncbi:hypothetical protein HMI54_013998 [Coelomomyces lativittatus]|nr:hypothetical protein HMI54_013998 [Coelomomyces lativittatus]